MRELRSEWAVSPAGRSDARCEGRRPQTRRRWLIPSLVLVAGAALAAPIPWELGSARAATEAKVVTAEAPITAVTVYSDRARVTRTARLTVGGGAGGQRVQLPILVSPLDPASIRVEVQGAEVSVQRVEIGHVEASELPLPAGEAEKLLAELDHTDDLYTQAVSEKSAYAAQIRLLSRILPSTSGLGMPAAPGSGAPPKLNPTGWPAVMQFVRQAIERANTKTRELDEQLLTLRRKRQELLDKGQKLGGLSRRAGYRVTATLLGAGTANVSLSYMVSRARWRPTYDIQLQPAQNRVELSLAGLVSQETGEDWTDAALTLSTAVPATATQLPKLLTWKLGERERFIPTPAPQHEGAPPPPNAPPLLLAEADPGEALRQRLLQRLGMQPTGGTSPDSVDDELDGMFIDTRRAKKEPTKTAYDLDKAQKEQSEDDLLRPESTVAPAAPPPPPPSPMPSSGMAAPAEPMPIVEEMQVISRSQQSRISNRRGPAGGESIVGIGLAPPPGYTPPSYDPTLPAALAGGYDLVFPAIHRDTVKSAQGTRRVALLSRSFPVTVSRKVFAALAPEAFLVAEIKNPGTEPLPGGEAHLFVGADPAGVARLQLIAPGEVFTLPLGLDRAIRPVRNVQVTTVEKGVFSKDEVSEYVVTTEVVNPYRMALDLRLYDQIPIIGDKNVEIRLVRSDPQAKLDDKKGSLEWRMTLAPGAKTTTTFVYSLRRPKGYRLNQAQY